MVAQRLRPKESDVMRIEFPKAIRLWRDDLARIVSMLEEASGSKLELFSGDYAIESVEDLAQVADDMGSDDVGGFDALLRDPDLDGKIFRVTSDGPAFLVSLQFDDGSRDEYLRYSTAYLQLKHPDNGMRWVAGEIQKIVEESRRRGLARYVKRGRPIVYGRTRAERPSLWQRKRDDIRITVVSNSISLFLGALLGYLISKIQ
ncbi:hypothetical protein [Micromonospora arida]|uniref:hypothetical protein n=1 Tax=Micromonospora arida TaxID=2203715 RepID=UPI0033F4D403